MKFLRKKMTLALAIILVLSSFTASFAAVSMSDLNEVSWAKATIEKWANMGLVSGYSDGSFKPGNAITRAEFTVIAYNAFELDTTSRKAFDDVKTSDWFYQPVSQMAAQGFISGYGDGSFKPNAPITRAEAAIILVSIQGLKANPEAISAFEDANLIPPWAAESIGAAFEAKNISGYPDGTFRPNANITRAESVVMLNNAIYGENTYANNWILNEPGIYGSSSEPTVVEGNVYVRSESISLTNFVIKGDLIISKEVAEGTVSLNNVTVEGDTEIYGGGLNSIYVRNSKLGNVMVRKANQLVRIVAVGNSTFGTLTSYSGVKLEESNITSGGGFGEIIIEKGATGQINLIGNFSKVTIRATGVEVIVPTKTVIAELNIEARIRVTGNGTVDLATVELNGVTFETAPTSVVAGSNGNVTVTIGGVAKEVTQAAVAPAPAPGPAPALPQDGSSGGTDGGGTDGDNDGGTGTVEETEYNIKLVKYTDSNETSIDISIGDDKGDSKEINYSYISNLFELNKGLLSSLDNIYEGFIVRALTLESDSEIPYAYGLASRIKNMNGAELSVFNYEDIKSIVDDILDADNATFDNIKSLAGVMATAELDALLSDMTKLYPADTDVIPSKFEIKVLGDVISNNKIIDLKSTFLSALNSITLKSASESAEALLSITFGNEKLEVRVEVVR